MQVSEVKNNNLEREYKVTVDAKTIEKKMEEKLKSIGNRAKIPGFRPGHVPVKILKQRYGKSVMGEVLENTVNTSSSDVIKQKGDRPALQPKIEVTSFDEGKDLEFTMSYEVLPELPEVDTKKIKLEKPIYELPKKEVDEAIERLAARQKSFEPRAKTAKAKDGDAVKMDFEGFLKGEAFQGGKAEGHTLELGSGQFIPGFEEQLVGTKAGDSVTVKVTFPKEYHSKDLAGQEAEFKVKVHEVMEPKPAKIDDDMAKSFGFDDLTKLREAIEEQLKKDYDELVRTKQKKQLFDHLEKAYDFAAPQGMVDLEFNMIWERLQQAKEQGDDSLDKPEDELREEYQAIAQRRVRLGLLLAEVGRKNNLKVSQDELSRAVMDQARMFPGQEAKIFEFYQQNPQQLEELRGPILEEKAVDFLFDKITFTDKKVTIEELTSEDDESDQSSSAKKKPAAKKTASKKTTGDAEKKPAKASTAKKTTAKKKTA